MNMCDTLCNVHSMMFTRNALHQHCLFRNLALSLKDPSNYKYIYTFISLFVSLRRDPAPAPLNLRDCSRRPVDKFTGNTGPSRGTGYYLAVTRVWCPADLRTVFVRNRSFIPGVETPSASLAEAMDTLWHRIDSTFQ